MKISEFTDNSHIDELDATSAGAAVGKAAGAIGSGIKNFANLPEKTFFLGIVITQLIRGAGYFNGSFLLCLLLIMSLTLIKVKNEQK